MIRSGKKGTPVVDTRVNRAAAVDVTGAVDSVVASLDADGIGAADELGPGVAVGEAVGEAEAAGATLGVAEALGDDVGPTTGCSVVEAASPIRTPEILYSATPCAVVTRMVFPAWSADNPPNGPPYRDCRP
jgi:hypothetical protein